MLTIVETPGVPHPVVAPGAAMEVHAICSVKHVDPIVGVLAGVTVHDVHQHDHAQPVGLVDHRLELVRGPKPAAGLQATGTASGRGWCGVAGLSVLANPAAGLQADASTGLPPSRPFGLVSARRLPPAQRLVLACWWGWESSMSRCLRFFRDPTAAAVLQWNQLKPRVLHAAMLLACEFDVGPACQVLQGPPGSTEQTQWAGRIQQVAQPELGPSCGSTSVIWTDPSGRKRCSQLCYMLPDKSVEPSGALGLPLPTKRIATARPHIESLHSTHRKKVGDMVAKATIVGVLLHCHDLDAVVAQLADAGEHVHAEVQVAVDLGFCAAHAHVALIDAQCPWPAAGRCAIACECAVCRMQVEEGQGCSCILGACS